MKKYGCFFALLVCILFVNCKGNETVDNNAPVDLSDVMELYESTRNVVPEWSDDSLFNDLREKMNAALPESEQFYPDDSYMYLFEDNELFVELPEYKDSKDEFLSKAQDSYNSFALLNAVWTNFDVWCRLVVTGDAEYQIDEMRNANLGMNTDVIKDKKLSEAAKHYVLEMNEDMLIAPEEWEENDDYNPGVLYNEFFESCVEFMPKACEDEEAFEKEYNASFDKIVAPAEKVMARYEKAGGDDRLGIVLKAMCDCESFVDQTALLMMWANNEFSPSDDYWIIAVAERLMHSKKYSPLLSNVWLVWRTLIQPEYGMSRDSRIPNDMYNEYRKLCFKTVLKYLESHPDDAMAKNCAIVLMSRGNVNRGGEYPFGNQNAIEALNVMPERYKGLSEDDVDDAEEDDVEEEE